MADEHQFIENGLERAQIDEFFQSELSRAGYGGMDVAQTPMGTQIVLKAEKPGMVIGKGGKNIRKITSELESRFDMDDPQIDVQEVDEPDLNAQIVADRLANALERGWYFRKAGHTTIDRIMESGAKGAEIVLSGKVTGARSRVEKFNRGYIKHNGEPAETVVDHGQGVAVMKLGTIGVDVKIIGPDAVLPDDFEVYEDVEVEDYIEESDESVEELLEGEPEEGEVAEGEAEVPEDLAETTEGDAADAEEEALDEADIEEEVLEDEEEPAPAVEPDEEIEDELEELEESVEDEADDLMEQMPDEADEGAQAPADDDDSESADADETDAEGDDE
ncbi:30S ribosomal protein S3 [Haloglomus halophilum]|uniref:30S ribosomal protein S3 n=1 Tax=Haloglomus halophilum TaxID=2962672 RepID=UPI0020C9DD68|nr:30S ribosomal protein S3 [Haloglomus halophilum]